MLRLKLLSKKGTFDLKNLKPSRVSCFNLRERSMTIDSFFVRCIGIPQSILICRNLA